MIRNLRELYQYRALLAALVQRELQSRYRNSALGFLWTFLNPILLMLVYGLVFSVYMRSNTPDYTYFLFVGLLPWVCFSTSLVQGTGSISERADLLTKVRFPAQVLPAATVTVQVTNFLLSIPLMVGLGLLHGRMPSWHIVFLPLVLLVQVIFTLALVYLLAALNVGLRDVQHVAANLVTLWMFVTPILYPLSTIPEQYRPITTWANPMSGVILAYHDIFYHRTVPDLLPLGVLLAGSLLLLSFSSEVFEARRETFAELA